MYKIGRDKYLEQRERGSSDIFECTSSAASDVLKRQSRKNQEVRAAEKTSRGR